MMLAARFCRRYLSMSSVLAARITRVPLPALSPTMESGSIVSWDKKEGDRLNEGDLLAEIETDKATMAFETPEEGYLAKILIPAGTKGVALGKPLCIIVEEEADIGKFKNFSIEEAIAAAGGDGASFVGGSPAPSDTPTSTPSPPPPPPPSVTTTAPPQMQAMSPSTPTGQTTMSTGPRTFASPLARRLARDMGCDLPSSGSGFNGRVVASDLQSGMIVGGAPSHASSASSGDFTDLPLTNMRMTIAKRLTQSKQTIPHYYLTVTLRVDELLELRSKFNEMLAKENVKLSVNDFIIKAAALACKRVPQVNSHWQETFIRQYNNVDVCVAVSTDSGLITPIVFDAQNKGIQEIGQEIKSLAERARLGKLQPQEYQGGTFTISNLGMFNINHFTAVINPPQSAILAVGTTQQTVVPATNNNESQQQFKVVNTLNVTLSCDHRVVDGAVGSQWLIWFRRYMEKPHSMLL